MKRWFRKLWCKVKRNWPFVLGGFLAIVAGVEYVISNFNSYFSSAKNYEQLKVQMLTIKENPELLLSNDCSITVKDGLITVTLIDEKNCEVKATFDQNFNVVNDPEAVGRPKYWIELIVECFLCFILGAVIMFSSYIVLFGMIIVVKAQILKK